MICNITFSAMIYSYIAVLLLGSIVDWILNKYTNLGKANKNYKEKLSNKYKSKLKSVSAGSLYYFAGDFGLFISLIPLLILINNDNTCRIISSKSFIDYIELMVLYGAATVVLVYLLRNLVVNLLFEEKTERSANSK